MSNKLNRPTSSAAGWLSLAGIVLVIIVAVIFALPKLAKDDVIINVDDYITMESGGYNNYGESNLYVDYKGILDLIVAESGLKNEAMDSIQQFPIFEIKTDGANTLKNGDVVNYTVTVNKPQLTVFEETFDVKLSVTEQNSLVVEGLADVVEFDPFEHLIIDTSDTVDGAGSFDAYVEYRNGDKIVKWTVEHNGENGKLNNGDIVNLKIKENIDDDLIARSLGIKLTRKECENYTINSLPIPAIDVNIFYNMHENDQKILDKIVTDWVVSGLNDGFITDNPRQFKPYGYLYYTNTDKTNLDQGVDGMLFAIYSISDVIYGRYYIYIGIKGNFHYNNDGLFIANGERLPTSFVKYEKETVRYDKNEGWEQGHEGMGFLADEYIAIAGHRESKDSIAYIQKTFGMDYKYRFGTVDIVKWFEQVDAELGIESPEMPSYEEEVLPDGTIVGKDTEVEENGTIES